MATIVIGGDGKVGDKEFIIIRNGKARVLDLGKEEDARLTKRADVELRVVEVNTPTKYRYLKLKVKFLKNLEHPDSLVINNWTLRIKSASWQFRSTGLFSSDYYHPVIITDPHGFTLADEIRSGSFNMVTFINRFIEMSQHQSIDRYKIDQLEKKLRDKTFELSKRIAKLKRELRAEMKKELKKIDKK